MPRIAEKTSVAHPRITSRGVATVEYWEIRDINDDGSTNYSGVIDPYEAIVAGATPGLPKRGDPHPAAAFASAGVIGIDVSQVVAPWSIIVIVVYQSWGLYRGGPRPVVDARATMREIRLPVWRKFTAGTVFGWEEDTSRGTIRPRPVAIRTVTKFLPGDQVDAVQTAIATNVGQLYTIPAGGGGVPYILSDQTSAVYDGATYTRVDYRFERDQAMPAFGVNDPILGNEVAIPALPPLYFWVTFPGATSAVPPIVRAMPPTATTGTALPGFP